VKQHNKKEKKSSMAISDDKSAKIADLDVRPITTN
jgi:hypothetical protein